VVAAAVGGLRTAVRDGYSGILVDGHEPAAYARELEKLIASPSRLAELSRGAIEHASAFGWPATADKLIGVYTGAMNAMDEAAATVRA
jgi:D-inositol-3-phosphate glycosyltransferase